MEELFRINYITIKAEYIEINVYIEFKNFLEGII